MKSNPKRREEKVWVCGRSEAKRKEKEKDNIHYACQEENRPERRREKRREKDGSAILHSVQLFEWGCMDVLVSFVEKVELG